MLLQLWLAPGWLFCLPLRRAQRHQPRALQVCVGLVVQAATHLVDCSLVHSLPWRPIGCGQGNPGASCGGFLRTVGTAHFRHRRWGLRTESLIGANALAKASRLCLTGRAASGVLRQSRGQRSTPQNGARSSSGRWSALSKGEATSERRRPRPASLSMAPSGGHGAPAGGPAVPAAAPAPASSSCKKASALFDWSVCDCCAAPARASALTG